MQLVKHQAGLLIADQDAATQLISAVIPSCVEMKKSVNKWQSKLNHWEFGMLINVLQSSY
jgi:hypothetical protein